MVKIPSKKSILNFSQGHSPAIAGNSYHGHTLDEALEQAALLFDVESEMVFVDRGYKGVNVEHVQIWRSW